MNIHEYQAKELFRKCGIPVPAGAVANSAVEAEFAMRRLGVETAVVKAQIHAGGRGKGGGVKLVKSPEECASVAQKMLGMNLVTHQTGPAGKIVHKVYVEAASAIDREYYLAMLLDRESASVAVMFSTAGGMDIEEVAEKTPEKITTVLVDPTVGLRSHHLKTLVNAFEGSKAAKSEFSKVVANLYKMFLAHDFSLLEINPLVVTKTDGLLALDGKMNFDDNALFRHPEIAAMRDFAEEDMREVEASKFGLSYIGLEGNIGCLVNGAGLAMATMDIIKFYGGQPANFLDVGGGASQEQVKQAFRIILTDKHVKGVFVNIFGGIMKCDTIANGIVAAARELGLQVPLVVRLEGTNVEQGRALLNDSGLRIMTAEDMADGARKIVEAVRG